jgi:hypothetical protein
MKSLRILGLFVVLLLFVCVTKAQLIYLPTSHEAYPFLKRLEARQLITDYRDAAKPISRMHVARLLKSVEPRLDELTIVERDQFAFLRSEFSYEWGLLEGDPEPTDLRFHLVSLDAIGGKFNFDLNLAFDYLSLNSLKARKRSQGFKIFGYAFGSVGYYLNFVDYRESGDTLNPTRIHSPETGIVLTKQSADVIEYNSTEAQFTLQLGAFELSLEKIHNVWGYGHRGNMIFSTKPPSYPQVKLRVPIASWLDFVYVHADLHSNVVDSSRSYLANSSQVTDFYRTVYRLKYMAAHLIEFTIVDGLDMALGESIVYSDKNPQLIYLIPLMFFKSGEHYNRDTDNVQFFGTLDLNLIKGVNLYGTLFIDELTTDDLFNPDKARNQLGYTVGTRMFDLPFDNVELAAEYSRLNPWVYTHKYPAATFTNNGYDLGHWVGQNGDDVYVELLLKPIRALRFGAFWERYRKGGSKDISYQYQTPSQPFLYSPVRKLESIGLFGHFQFVRDGFIDLEVKTNTLRDEADPSANLDGSIDFRAGIRYGIW